MIRNGTVCHAGRNRMAARLSPTKITQAMSPQDERSRRSAWRRRIVIGVLPLAAHRGQPGLPSIVGQHLASCSDDPSEAIPDFGGRGASSPIRVRGDRVAPSALTLRRSIFVLRHRGGERWRCDRSMAVRTVSMRSIVVLGLIAALVGLSGEPAGAHAALVSSDPAAAQRLATTPALVVLRFTEPLNDRLSRATVIGPDGAAVPRRRVGAWGASGAAADGYAGCLSGGVGDRERGRWPYAARRVRLRSASAGRWPAQRAARRPHRCWPAAG